MEHTYSFRCPTCNGSWTFEQAMGFAKDMLAGYTGVSSCPLCNEMFSWSERGVMMHKKWYEGKRHYKPHPCKWCGKKLEGRRNFCNISCNKKFYYRNKNPIVKRKTK